MDDIHEIQENAINSEDLKDVVYKTYKLMKKKAIDLLKSLLIFYSKEMAENIESKFQTN
ncbi:8417_t:CDS:2 [Gigaspora margarita]|uniref:8417_t:CDS:1 n=1 Tax=Gigaspora margarita TaxID=4874 RepID=A0ABN7UBJ3_GIGMA|nr:8417_t:CDS:2 [Gigaspora margarita]